MKYVPYTKSILGMLGHHLHYVPKKKILRKTLSTCIMRCLKIAMLIDNTLLLARARSSYTHWIALHLFEGCGVN